MLFIAIECRRDGKGLKMEIAEAEKAAKAACHGNVPKDRIQGQTSTEQTPKAILP